MTLKNHFRDIGAFPSCKTYKGLKSLLKVSSHFHTICICLAKKCSVPPDIGYLVLGPHENS